MAAAESDEQAIGDVEEIVAADIEIIPLLVDFADVVIVLENRVAAGVNRCAAVRFGERLEIGKTRGVHPAGRNDVSGERSPGPRVIAARNTFAKSLVVHKEKELVLQDGPAQSAAELIAVVSGSAVVVEEVARV